MGAGASTRSGSSRRSRRMVAEINVVPYIDVMLVLLVIFMVTAPLLPPGAIDLPSAGQSNAKTEGFIELLIQRNGAMSLRSRNTRDGEQTKERVGKTELLEAVKRMQADQNLPVVISADKSIAYEKVVEAMDLLRRGGIQRVALMVKASN
ncbi:MAG: ExbD/TolR family protein [Betaproteobacteria bacterium]|jgi:biopolymer transport protein TolR|nr:ExbD/TolR family protein [Pseudomonadota bacterium]NBO04495.1 ExbD/TolR family protein [Betaproteobacteria bacterium]NBP34820.1 ExbD/TolR family protein [Betaproteobacteria bacterium]NBP37865.1 ExbD/TolR family protein [Betaproteobacteria bacterium]NBQ77726.1 ExbD/TolR family protein [Betaproteobacteria bacterium]